MVMPHGRRNYSKASDMSKANMFPYPQLDHVLPHCKCVMKCCSKCSRVNLPYQEIDDQYNDTRPSICFHIYHLIASCSTHGRIPLTEKNCCECKQDSASKK